MDDKTTSSPNATEYNFPEADAGPENVASEQPAADTDSVEKKVLVSMKNINLHKLIVPGTIVIGIFLIYTVFSFYGARKTRALEQQKIQSQEVAPLPIISAQPTTEAVVQQPFNDQIYKMQTTVQQKIGEVEQTIASNNNELASLRDAISKSQQDVSNINQNVNQLTAEINQILTEIQELKAKKQTKPKNKASKPPIAYHIRAIVPGRVWIESDNGKSLTLRVGDHLNGYGTVEVISPKQGMVLMSSGLYIQYGVNDF